MTQTATLEPPANPTECFVIFARCPLCGSARNQSLYANKECGNIVRCSQCQLRFTRSRSTASMPELRRQSREPLPDMALQKQRSRTDDFREILNRIKRYQPDGKLLELGCCTGHFLALAGKAGYAGIGIEPDPWSAEYARREFGLNIHETPVPELHFADQSFDVIAMFHVMEHLTKPMQTLWELRRILKDTGLLAIEVPIIDTLFPMAMGQSHRQYMFDQTLFLSRKNAAAFLHKTGFEILHTELTGRRISLQRLARPQRKHTKRFGRFLERTLTTLGIQDWTVHLKVRDNYRIYCRKAS